MPYIAELLDTGTVVNVPTDTNYYPLRLLYPAFEVVCTILPAAADPEFPPERPLRGAQALLLSHSMKSSRSEGQAPSSS